MKANCIRCGKPSQTDFLYLGALCAGCFCSAIEKRIRKHVRINEIFQKGDKIVAVGDINQYLIPRIIKGLPAKIVNRTKEPAKSSKGEKVVVNITVDDIGCEFLTKILMKKGKTSKGLSIVRTATDSELCAFAEFKGLKFEPREKDKEIMKMLEILEAKHPETKFSLAKSVNLMEKTTRS